MAYRSSDKCKIICLFGHVAGMSRTATHPPSSARLNLDATIPLRAVRPSVIDVVVLGGLIISGRVSNVGRGGRAWLGP